MFLIDQLNPVLIMKVISLILFIVGILLLFLGAFFLFYALRFKKNAIRTVGTVIEVKTSTGRTTSITYSPILEFASLDGEKHIYDVSRFNYTKYKVGDKIEIVYSKKDPSDVNIDSFYNIFIPPMVILLLSILCIIIALVIYSKFRN